ncbi:MAG: DUF5666 domain-containing protein [Gemmatimonadaceae bacterium]
MKTLMFLSLPIIIFACNRGADSSSDTTQVSQSTATSNPNAPPTVRGAIVSASANQLVVKTDTGNVTVTVTQPFHFYARVPSQLANVKENTFIGVTTVRQPDGSERATEIHIFPEELRGTGEGSRMMAPNANASRMTNGNVSTSRMTNGTASQSRMSNGNVSSANGSTLIVQYAGGSQTVTVPSNTPVTELKIVSRKLAAGDQVAVMATRAPDGTLTANKAISTAR